MVTETRQSALELGELIQIEVESLNYSAHAVGRADGFVVFVDGGVPGDRLLARITRVKKNYALAETMDVLSPSLHRCDPPCVHFTEGCGGCQWQHIDYEHQLQWKKEIVTQALRRIGKFEQIPDIEIRGMDFPLHYRNKLRLFPSGNSGFPGMRRSGSHQVVPIRECLISSELINSVIPMLQGDGLNEIGIRASVSHQAFLRKNLEQKTRRYKIPYYQEIMLLCTYNQRSPGIHSDMKTLSEIPGVASVFYRAGSDRPGKFIHEHGEPVIRESIRGIEYKIGPDCFFQVNTSGIEALVDLVRENAVPNSKLVFDAHCGVGTFALQMADISDAVWGADTSSSAVSLARSNADDNGITNASFRSGKASHILENELKHAIIDLAILDPPRGGCEKADLRAIILSKPEKLIYISCNPTTLARDLCELVASGYRLLKLAMVDMFPMTYHLEVVAICSTPKKMLVKR